MVHGDREGVGQGSSGRSPAGARPGKPRRSVHRSPSRCPSKPSAAVTDRRPAGRGPRARRLRRAGVPVTEPAPAWAGTPAGRSPRTSPSVAAPAPHAERRAAKTIRRRRGADRAAWLCGADLSTEGSRAVRRGEGDCSLHLAARSRRTVISSTARFSSRCPTSTRASSPIWRSGATCPCSTKASLGEFTTRSFSRSRPRSEDRAVGLERRRGPGEHHRRRTPPALRTRIRRAHAHHRQDDAATQAAPLRFQVIP